MKEIDIKAIILVALPIILVLSTLFCAVFGISMAAKQEEEDKPAGTLPEEEPPSNTPEDPNNGQSPDEPDEPDDPDDKQPPDGDPDNKDPDNQEPENTKKKYVAFTFDDGPAYQSGLTKKFVDELAKYNGEATFFLVGDRIKSTTASGLAYAVEHGWEIGIHAYTHKYYFNSNCSEDIYQSEIKKTEDAIHKYLPEYEIKFFRPPGGTLTAERKEDSPYAIILWNVDSKDWQYKGNSTEEERDENVQNIVDEVISTVKDGSIILMHEIYNNSYLAFCEILKQLSADGYEFVSVSELLGENFQAGKTFYSGK